MYARSTSTPSASDTKNFQKFSNCYPCISLTFKSTYLKYISLQSFSARKSPCSQDCSLTLNISLVFCCSLGVTYPAMHPGQQSKKRIPGSVYTGAFLQLSLPPPIQLLCVQHQITMLFFHCHTVLQPHELATYIQACFNIPSEVNINNNHHHTFQY